MGYARILILCLFLWGCEGDGLLGPDELRLKPPKKGSVFYYDSYQIDDDGNRVSGTTTYTTTVVDTDIEYKGKSGVFVLENRYDIANSDPTLSYYYIGEDNDLYSLFEMYSTSKWMKIPMTTLAETIDTVDATWQSGTVNYIFRNTFIDNKPYSLDSIQVSGKRFRSRNKYKIVTYGVSTQEGILESTNHYLPNLGGMLCMSTLPATYNAATRTWTNGSETKLRRYEEP
jgi:hypothetical protein